MQPILVSQTQPMAAFRGSRKLTLAAASTDGKSSLETLHFTRGVDVIGVVITVALLGAPVQGRRDATLADIDIRIESQDLRPTRDYSDDDSLDNFCDAASASLPLTYLAFKMTGSPDVKVQAKWKNPNHATVFNDCIVDVTLVYNWEG